MQCLTGRASRPESSGGAPPVEIREARPEQPSRTHEEKVPEVEQLLLRLEGFQQEAEQMRLRLGAWQQEQARTTDRLREILGRATPGPPATPGEQEPPAPIPNGASSETSPSAESQPLLGEATLKKEERPCLRDLVDSRPFEAFTAALVVCYGICLGIDVHTAMTKTLGTQGRIPFIPEDVVHRYLPRVFLFLVSAYCVEMALRVLAYKWKFFYDDEEVAGHEGDLGREETAVEEEETAPGEVAGDVERCCGRWCAEMWGRAGRAERSRRRWSERMWELWQPVRVWNVCDLCILVFTVVDLCISMTHTEDEKIRILVNFRALRIARFLRTLRLFSVAMKVPDLRKMIWAVFSCTKSFVWGMALMFLMFYFFAIFLEDSGMHILIGMQHERAALGAPDEGLDARITNLQTGLETHWDGLYCGMLSLIFAVSGGLDWENMGRPFLDINIFYGCVFTGFIFISLFGTLNVLVGVFVQKSGEIEQWEHKLALEEAMEESHRHHENKDSALRLFFRKLAKGAPTISMEQLETQSTKKEFLKYFRHLGIHVDSRDGTWGKQEVLQIFEIFDKNKDGSLTEDEFVQVCRRLQGSVMPAQLETLNMKIDRLTKSKSVELNTSAA